MRGHTQPQSAACACTAAHPSPPITPHQTPSREVKARSTTRYTGTHPPASSMLGRSAGLCCQQALMSSCTPGGSRSSMGGRKPRETRRAYDCSHPWGGRKCNRFIAGWMHGWSWGFAVVGHSRGDRQRMRRELFVMECHLRWAHLALLYGPVCGRDHHVAVHQLVRLHGGRQQRV